MRSDHMPLVLTAAQTYHTPSPRHHPSYHFTPPPRQSPSATCPPPVRSDVCDVRPTPLMWDGRTSVGALTSSIVADPIGQTEAV